MWKSRNEMKKRKENRYVDIDSCTQIKAICTRTLARGREKNAKEIKRIQKKINKNSYTHMRTQTQSERETYVDVYTSTTCKQHVKRTGERERERHVQRVKMEKKAKRRKDNTQIQKHNRYVQGHVTTHVKSERVGMVKEEKKMKVESQRHTHRE